jgi:hypothetical protein
LSLESSVALWDTLSFWFITAGIIATFVGGVASIRSRHWNRQLTAQQEAQRIRDKSDSDKALAALNLEVAQANERAANAIKASSKAQAHAAESELELAKLKAPRSISEEQAEEIANALRKYPSQQFQIATFWDLKEPVELSKRLYAILLKAGWTYAKPEHPGIILGGLEGIHVFANPALPGTKAAGDALVTALNGAGLTADSNGKAAPDNLVNLINLNVGTKPLTSD